jgi:hypothetical protein
MLVGVARIIRKELEKKDFERRKNTLGGMLQIIGELNAMIATSTEEKI